jgi:hypothetical protein
MAVQKAVDIFSRYSGLRAIHRFGSISVPGISDLDLLLVFDDAAPPVPQPWRRHFSERERYLLMHSPAIISTSLLPFASRLTRLHHLDCVWGEPATFSPPDEGHEFVERLISAEHAVRILASLMRQWVGQVIKQRPTLCELHSIQYEVESLGQPLDAWDRGLGPAIRVLRHTWFDLPKLEREQRLIALVEKGLAIELDLLTVLGEWARRSMGNINLPARRLATRWPGLYLQPAEAPYPASVAVQRRWLARASQHLTSFRLRTYLSRFSPVQVRLDGALVALLRGNVGALPQLYADLQRQRQTVLAAYTRFHQRLGGDFGSLHLPPFAP